MNRLLLAVLVGCSGGFTDGLTEAASETVASCAHLEGDRRDWCAVEALRLAPRLVGEEVAAVCDTMKEPDAFDHCVELAIRSVNPPPVEICARVHNETMRGSCRLEQVEQVLSGADAPDFAAALELCRTTAPLELHCLVHIVGVENRRWRFQSPQVFMSDISAMVQAFDGASQFSNLAEVVGRTSREMGFNNPDVCSAFQQPSAYPSCLTGLRNVMPDDGRAPDPTRRHSQGMH